ncbi:MAG: hypothetical protein AAFV98_21730 [Chloroflexota bacterium]
MQTLPATRAIERYLTSNNPHWTDAHRAQQIVTLINHVQHEGDKRELERRLSRHIERLQATPIEPTEQPQTPQFKPVASAQHIKVDVHMCRLANELLGDTGARLAQLYFTMRTVNSRRDGSGVIRLDELQTMLTEMGIEYSTASLYNWLHAGNSAGFWQYDKTNRRLFLSGLLPLADMLIKQLPDERVPFYMGDNAPGGRMVWIPAGHTLGTFKAFTLSAWVSQQGDNLIVSNAKMGELWGVSERTIVGWKQAGNLDHTPNYADLGTLETVPKHAFESHTKDNETRHAVRLPNTYHAPGDVVKHDAIGNARRLRQVVNTRLEIMGFNPDDICAIGQVKHKQYFTGTRKLAPYKQADKHQRKHGISHTAPQYYRDDERHAKSFTWWQFVGDCEVFAHA